MDDEARLEVWTVEAKVPGEYVQADPRMHLRWAWSKMRPHVSTSLVEAIERDLTRDVGQGLAARTADGRSYIVRCFEWMATAPDMFGAWTVTASVLTMLAAANEARPGELVWSIPEVDTKLSAATPVELLVTQGNQTVRMLFEKVAFVSREADASAKQITVWRRVA